MSLLSTLGRAFFGGVQATDVIAARHSSEFPSFDEQMSEVWARGRGETWRTASVDDALGSPAIFGGVALITNTLATLSFEAYRNGEKLSQEQTPRIIQRPDPFSTLRSFLQRSAFYLVTRGELPWWIAKRDPLDNSPMSVFPVPPWELTREENNADRLRPIWRWGDRVIPNEDLKIIQYLPGRNGRGFGPLQKCGAAVSVAVESEQWAANFFSGALPSVIGTTDQELDEHDIEALNSQWLEKPGNVPRWLWSGLTLSEAPYDPAKAQLRDVRDANVGDAARMLNIPGGLIEYTMAGSSLTYRNDETVWADFQKRCLGPHYMEPMEQEMSDLLSRSTVARFNSKQLLRGSAKERMEVHNLAIPLGIYDADTAAQEEGYAPGNVDYMPVPQALPQAIPTRLPVDGVTGPSSSTPPLTLAMLGAGRSAMADLRCPKCGWLAGRVAGSAEIQCRKCKTLVTA